MLQYCLCTVNILDITRVLKKAGTTNKNIYSPISTLSNFSKVFEKLIFIHINSSFMNPKLSKYLVVFRKNHITQHVLLKMIGTWDSMLNKGNKVKAVVCLCVCMCVCLCLLFFHHKGFS